MVYEIMGARVHATSAGEGEPLVVLHGWGASRAVMRPVIDGLSGRRRVISLDFPGFGASPPPPSAWGVPEYAEMTAELLRRMGVVWPDMLGHSFGGRVIIYAVGALGLEAGRLVLVDSAGVKPAPKKPSGSFVAAKKLASLLPNKQRETVMQRAREKYGSADYLAAQGVMREVLVKTVNLDLAGWLPAISNEALLIWGGQDTTTPLSEGRRMAELLPSSRMEVVEGAGHYPFLDAPDAFWQALGRFV